MFCNYSVTSYFHSESTEVCLRGRRLTEAGTVVGGVAVVVVLSVAPLAVVTHDALGGAVTLARLVVAQRAVVVALTS